MRFLSWLSFIFLSTSLAFGQSTTGHLQEKNLLELRQMVQKTPIIFQKNASLNTITFSPFFSTSRKQAAQVSKAALPLPPAWRYEDLAIFCKLEVKMEKALNMPVKVRLGEVQSVERMEGKLQTGVNYKE